MGWTRAEAERIRRLLIDEGAGPDVVPAVRRLDALLDRLPGRGRRTTHDGGADPDSDQR